MRYANIITTIAVAVVVTVCTMINNRLNDITTRLRAVEIRVTAIATVLGISQGQLNQAAREQAGGLNGDETHLAGQ